MGHPVCNSFMYVVVQILRTDIVMDVGNSLNPAVDIGQIERAFTQVADTIFTKKLHAHDCNEAVFVLFTAR